MERIRVAAIIPMNGGFALMHRKNVKNGSYSEFYTFVGGALEENEEKDEAIKREVEEELGINVKVLEKLYEQYSESFKQTEIYYLCEYLGGEFGTGKGEEFTYNPIYADNGNYFPEILTKEEIEDALLVPVEIKEMFLNDIERGKFDKL